MRPQNVIARGERQRRAAASESCRSLTLIRDLQHGPRTARSAPPCLAEPLKVVGSGPAAQTPRREGGAYGASCCVLTSSRATAGSPGGEDAPVFPSV